MKTFLSSCVFALACAAGAQTPAYLACAPATNVCVGSVCTYTPVTCTTKGILVSGAGPDTVLTPTGITFPDGSVQTTASVSAGGLPTPVTTDSAQINEIDNLSASVSVAATRPQGGTGSTPTKKDSTNCLSAWTISGSTGTYSGCGHRYCTSGEQSAAHSNQSAHGVTVDSYGYITLTQANAGSIAPVSNCSSGGTDAPLDMTTDYGETTYDSLCSNSLLTATTNVAGLALPACGTGITALVSETTDGSYGAASTLWPTNFKTTMAETSDHWLRSGMFMMDSVGATSRIEFDINASHSNGNYDGPGTSFNITAGRVEFLPQADYFIGHGTCSGTWCPMNLNLQTGSTAMSGCPGGEVCAPVSGHWYAFMEKGHLTGTTVTKYESQDKLTIPRAIYQYDELDLADCGTSGTSCPADYSRYTLTDPGNSNAPPQGYDVQYGWPEGFDTQWQLYPQLVNTTANLHVVNDVTQWYQIVKGTTSTNYISATADLGDFEGNNNTNNSDSTGGDTTTLSCTGGVAYDAAWFISSPASFNFNAVGDTCTATLPAAESTLTERVYLATNQFSTSSTGATVMMEFLSGSTNALEVYANDGSNNLELYLPSTTTSGAMTCTLDASTATQATVTDNPDYWDITWTAGSSTSTGTVAAAFDGAAPTGTNCTWLSTGIDTTSFTAGLITGITSVEFGDIADSGSVANWNFDMDMFGLSNGASFLGAAIPVAATTGTYQANLNITQSAGADVIPNPVQTPAATITGEPATYLACYATGGLLGHCATPPSGTPPTCGCVSP